MMAYSSTVIKSTYIASPFTREEGSGTLCTADLFFTSHGYRGATIKYELL